MAFLFLSQFVQTDQFSFSGLLSLASRGLELTKLEVQEHIII